MASRVDDDRNLTDGARRCARKLAEYAYRHGREGSAAEITVTYLMRALGRCRRSVQHYLRLLEREGYIRVDVVHGHRTRMRTGLVVQLLAPLFPRHHAERWPAKLAIPGATQESQKKRFIDSRGAGVVRMPVQSWALRCIKGVQARFIQGDQSSCATPEEATRRDLNHEITKATKAAWTKLFSEALFRLRVRPLRGEE